MKLHAAKSGASVHELAQTSAAPCCTQRFEPKHSGMAPALRQRSPARPTHLPPLVKQARVRQSWLSVHAPPTGAAATHTSPAPHRPGSPLEAIVHGSPSGSAAHCSPSLLHRPLSHSSVQAAAQQRRSPPLVVSVQCWLAHSLSAPWHTAPSASFGRHVSALQ